MNLVAVAVAPIVAICVSRLLRLQGALEGLVCGLAVGTTIGAFAAVIK